MSLQSFQNQLSTQIKINEQEKNKRDAHSTHINSLKPQCNSIIFELLNHSLNNGMKNRVAEYLLDENSSSIIAHKVGDFSDELFNILKRREISIEDFKEACGSTVPITKSDKDRYQYTDTEPYGKTKVQVGQTFKIDIDVPIKTSFTAECACDFTEIMYKWGRGNGFPGPDTNWTCYFRK